MLNLPIRNKTQESLRIMIEPVAQSFDVPAGKEVIISGDAASLSKGIEIEAWEDNFISLWFPCDVSVSLAGEKLEPLKEA